VEQTGKELLIEETLLALQKVPSNLFTTQKYPRKIPAKILALVGKDPVRKQLKFPSGEVN
jgi:hypothetical protein